MLLFVCSLGSNKGNSRGRVVYEAPELQTPLNRGSRLVIPVLLPILTHACVHMYSLFAASVEKDGNANGIVNRI